MYAIRSYYGLARQPGVQRRRRGDGDPLDIGVRDDLGPSPRGHVVPLGERPRGSLVGVADGREAAELGEIPHQVLSPIPAADHGDGDALRRGRFVRHRTRTFPCYRSPGDSAVTGPQTAQMSRGRLEVV